MKIANTRELIEINNHALDGGFNQCFDRELLARDADPDGLHIINMVLVHEHKAGVLVDPHLRCMAWVKMRGRAVPWQGLLDVEIDTYNALPGQEEYATIQDQFVQNWNATL